MATNSGWLRSAIYRLTAAKNAAAGGRIAAAKGGPWRRLQLWLRGVKCSINSDRNDTLDDGASVPADRREYAIANRRWVVLTSALARFPDLEGRRARPWRQNWTTAAAGTIGDKARALTVQRLLNQVPGAGQRIPEPGSCELFIRLSAAARTA